MVRASIMAPSPVLTMPWLIPTATGGGAVPCSASASASALSSPALALSARADSLVRAANRSLSPSDARARALSRSRWVSRPWPHVGLLVPVSDRAQPDSQVRGELLVAHPQRGLQRACVAPGPAGHHLHGLPPPLSFPAAGRRCQRNPHFPKKQSNPARPDRQ